MHYYKSPCLAVMIWAILVNTQTDIHTAFDRLYYLYGGPSSCEVTTLMFRLDYLKYFCIHRYFLLAERYALDRSSVHPKF